MTDEEKRKAETLLSKIEMVTGAFPDRSGPYATLIAEILQSVNGLRSVIGVVRPH